MSDKIRSPKEIVRRSLALFSVVGLGVGSPRNEVIRWLLDNDLWTELTPQECGLFDSATPSRKALINASWRSEALAMLLWCIGHIPELPVADQQFELGRFQDILPPFANVSVGRFAQISYLRPDYDLTRMANDCVDIHAEARIAKREGRKPRWPVDIGIIQERHHAINWVIGYENLPWDEVTTDI